MSSISTSTQFCAVIGNPIAHSMSPAIHNAALEALGLDFVYVACRVEDVAGALAGMRALSNFRGMSVTIPHKIEVMKHVDELPEVDRHIGSINTVIREEDGKLRGLGTDGPGAVKAFVDAGVELDGKSVLMIGAGGASRAVAFALADAAKLTGLTVLDIDEFVLKGLARDLEKGTNTTIKSALSNADSLAVAMAEADIVVNCTPIGMHPRVEASPVAPELLRDGQVVFDVVYNPLETKLLRDAKDKGLQAISGIEMFVNQAALQFKEFTGVDAPTDVMRKVLLEQLKK